jgi:hypothetical protein
MKDWFRHVLLSPLPARPRLSSTAAWVVIAVALGIVLRTHRLLGVDCTFDECSSWLTIRFSWSGMFDSIRQNVHPPVYYVLARLWVSVFNDSVMSMRMFAVAAGVLSIPVAAMLIAEGSARSQHGRNRDCALAALLLATCPLHVELSMQARMYSLAVLLFLVASWAALRVLNEGGSAIEWLVFGVCAVAMSLTHYFFLIVCGCELGFLVVELIRIASFEGWSLRVRRLLFGVSICLWLLAIVWWQWLPTFVTQFRQVEDDYWIKTLTFTEFVSVVARAFTYQEAGISPELGVFVLCVVVVLAMVVGLKCRSAGRLFAAAGLGTLAVVVVKGLYGQSLAVPRYLVAVPCLTALSVGLLISGSAFRERWKVVIASCGLAWQCSWTADYILYRDELSRNAIFEPLASVVSRQLRPGTIVICSRPVECVILKRYVSTPDVVGVVDLGWDYKHYAGGPILRPEDYVRVAKIPASCLRILVVDAGISRTIRSPEWLEVGVMRFGDPYNDLASIHLRTMIRCNVPAPDAEH